MENLILTMLNEGITEDTIVNVISNYINEEHMNINEISDKLADKFLRLRKAYANHYNQLAKDNPKEYKQSSAEADRKLGVAQRLYDNRAYRKKQQEMDAISDKAEGEILKSWNNGPSWAATPRSDMEKSFNNKTATEQAKTAQENALISQGIRKKLENNFQNKTGESPFESLSKEYFDDMMNLVEGLICEIFTKTFN